MLRFFACSLTVVATSCGTAAEPEPQPDLGVIGTRLTTPDVTAQGAGYMHPANKSKFRVGSSVTTKTELGFSKLVGSEGVFATVLESGWVLGIPNADAPSTKVGPLTQSPELHNQTVVSYFIGAGLPARQIGNVTVHADMEGAGVIATTPGPPGNGTFAGYTSILTRVVAGIQVPDSFAWAQFNANGEVVREGVYWPTIPDNVIKQAQALDSSVADPTRRMAFMSKVPNGLINGQVVIRHSSCSERSPFEVYAGYDLAEPESMGRVRHFDPNGAEFMMASEARGTTLAPRRGRTTR